MTAHITTPDFCSGIGILADLAEEHGAPESQVSMAYAKAYAEACKLKKTIDQQDAQYATAKKELHDAMTEYQKTGGGALSVPEAIKSLVSQRVALSAALRNCWESLRLNMPRAIVTVQAKRTLDEIDMDGYSAL